MEGMPIYRLATARQSVIIPTLNSLENCLQLSDRFLYDQIIIIQHRHFKLSFLKIFFIILQSGVKAELTTECLIYMSNDSELN